ncbi:threonine/homoserine/homoserine lactone efflux protein [Catenulispora sp. GP43]|uniref:GAP family protein n=1 Tax=Catenulispora sp. GP43 TaxID=3156263 RepID=UPI003517D3F3
MNTIIMLWEAIPSAVAAAFSPSTLLIVAGLLGMKHPLRNAVIFLITAAAVTLAVGFAVVEVLTNTSVDDSSKHPTVPPAIDLVIGLVILAFGLYVARRKPRAKKDKKKPEEREMRLLVVVGLGMVLGSPSPLYLASLHSVAKGNPGAAAVVFDVILLAVIVLLMAWLPIVYYAIAPERAAAALRAVNEWLARHGRVIGLSAAAIVGTYFVIHGIVGLA